MTVSKPKILIIEDDSIIAEDLAGFLDDFGYAAMDIASNAEEALKALKNELPDLVLLDVGLDGEVDGIQLAGIIQEKYDLPFIFLTAYYDDKTINRIKTTRPNGYLVKPIDEHSLKTSIEVALYNFSHRQPEKFSEPDSADHSGTDAHFFIKVKQGLLKIAFADILLVEACDNYCYLYTAEKKYMVSMHLKSIETKLPGKNFIRVHRSFVINLDKIQSIEDDVIVIGQNRIPIGKTYRNDVMKYIKLL